MKEICRYTFDCQLDTGFWLVGATWLRTELYLLIDTMNSAVAKNTFEHVLD